MQSCIAERKPGIKLKHGAKRLQSSNERGQGQNQNTSAVPQFQAFAVKKAFPKRRKTFHGKMSPSARFWPCKPDAAPAH